MARANWIWRNYRKMLKVDTGQFVLKQPDSKKSKSKCWETFRHVIDHLMTMAISCYCFIVHIFILVGSGLGSVLLTRLN